MRKIHRSEAGNLKIRLGFLEQDGVIEREPAVEGREAVEKWRVRTFPVGDFGDIAIRLSAKGENLSRRSDL